MLNRAQQSAVNRVFSAPASEAGFTLVQTILAVTLTMIVLLAFGTLAGKLFRTNAELNDRALDDQYDQVVARSLERDFERLGASLTFNASEAFSGELKPVFLSHPDYKVTDAGIYRSRVSSDAPLLSALLLRGNGSFFFHPASPLSVVTGEVGEDAASLPRVLEITEKSLIVTEGSEQVYAEELPAAPFPVTYFEIKTERIVLNNQMRCRTLYRRGASNDSMETFYESVKTCFAGKVQMGFVLPLDGALLDYSIKGGELYMLPVGDEPVRQPLYPLYREQRLVNAFAAADDGNVLLSGTTLTDKTHLMFLRSAAVINPLLTNNLEVTGADQTALNEGDVFLLIDYWNRKSVMLSLKGQYGSGNLEFVPLTKLNNLDSSWVWSGWQSALPDFVGHEFASGSRLVRLAPPVFYRMGGEDGGYSEVYRREGNAPWVILAPHAQDFNIFMNASQTEVNFKVTLSTDSEGVEGDNVKRRRNIVWSYFPRALNRAGDTSY